MKSIRLRWLFLLVTFVAFSLLAWTLYEARLQSRSVQESLTQQALGLGNALGPGLAAASHAARELEEIILSKLLDNARLILELEPILTGPMLDELALADGLDTVVVIAPDGEVLRATGERPPDDLLYQLQERVASAGDELLMGSTLHEGIEHLSAAIRGDSGTIALVRIHASSAYTYSRQLGVPNLLEAMVGSEGVLYLSYVERPGPINAAATWDGGSVPEPAAGDLLREIRGEKAFELEVPISHPAGHHASVRVGLDGSPLVRASASAWRRSLLVGLVLLGFFAAASGIAVLGRLREIEHHEAAQALAEAEREKRQSERLAEAGALAAGLAHEVRSPLNAIGLAAQRLERKLPQADDRHEIAQRLSREVRRLEEVLRSFLELARPVSDRRERRELRELADSAVQLLRAEAEDGEIELVVEEGSVWADIDPASIHRTIVNLIRNAVQASDPGDRISIRSFPRDDRAVIRVEDRGRGIPAENLSRIFDPFFTSRRDGSGLGLTLVRRVAEEHGGSISVGERPGGGVRAELSLPAIGR